MMGETGTTGTLNPTEAKASVLITISTPGADTPICRLGNSEEVISGLTVRDLIQRVISPNSLFSVGVPISQLQAESDTALAIGEMLSADCCEVIAPGKGSDADQSVSLDKSAREVAREQVGAQGNRFLNINLEVRSAADSVAPSGEERRQTQPPPTVEAEPETPPLQGIVPASPAEASVEDEASSPFAPTLTSHEPLAGESAPPGTGAPSATLDSEPDKVVRESFMPPGEGAESPFESQDLASATGASAAMVDDTAPEPGAARAGEPAAQTEPEVVAPSTEEGAGAPPVTSHEQSAAEIVTIVAATPTEQLKQQPKQRKEYVRKSDWLRAQFLPEVEALDFSGLFVGNLGLGIREEKTRKNVVLADPSRITEVLLRANGYRRSGDHPKALICYQELVDMDASNADFRFLLGKTLMELGQPEQALEAFLRAKELGHDGAEKEIEGLKRSGQRPKAALGFLRFWKQ